MAKYSVQEHKMYLIKLQHSGVIRSVSVSHTKIIMMSLNFPQWSYYSQ